MRFFGESDHPVNQFLIGNSGVFPEIECQAAGNGIDFRNVDFFTFTVKHIIDPDNALAVKKTEDFTAQFLDFVLQFVFNRCRKNSVQAGHPLASSGSEIFIPEVKEFIIVNRHLNR